MKRKKVIGISLTMILVLIFSWYLIDRFSYSKLLPYYPVKAGHDSTLTIAILGASWVAGGSLDSFLHNGLMEKGFANRIISSGQPGATTRTIYQNLFKERNADNSSRFIIEAHPGYCIVIGGVNDAGSQLGGKFYAYHMVQIIKTLLHYQIRPVIVPVPEFGIKETIDDMGFFSRYRNIISAYFNNNGEIDNIRTYREVLEKKLISENLKDSVIVIDFDNVCADYHKCPALYSGPSHLSAKGNEIFANTIIRELVGNIISSN